MPKNLSGWESYEALEEVIRRNADAVATALHCSPDLVRKWKEQPRTAEAFTQSGARNPLDRLEILMETITKIDGSPARADLIILYLCQKRGYLPPIRKPEKFPVLADAVRSFMAWQKESSESVVDIASVLVDGRVTRSELKKCTKEAMEGVQALLQLLEVMRGMTAEKL